MADSVKIRIDGDERGFEKSWANVQSSIKKGVGIAVKGIGTIGAVFTGVTTMALNFAGELEQNLGGSEAVFKEYSSSIQATANDAFKNMGLSASDFLANANKMGALFQGAGFSIQESAQLSEQAMQRAADVASIMGIDVSSAMEAIAGAAKGNFTMMDNLGVAMNATTIEAYALSKGITTSYNAMSNQQKIGLAMEMFLDKTAYAAGNYAKENDTLAGALTTAKAALENFMAGTGDVDDVVEALSNATKVILENIKDLLPALVEGLKGIVSQLVPMIPDILRELIPAVLSVVNELINELVAVAPQIVAAIADGIGDAVPLLKPLADMLKVVAENFQVVATAVVAGFVAFKGYVIITKVTAAFKAAQVAVAAYKVATAASQHVSTLLLSTMKPLEIIVGVLTGKIKLAEVATWALNKAKTALSGGIGLVIAAVVALVAAFASFISKQNETTNAMSEVKSAYNDAIKSIEDGITSSIAEAEATKSLKDELYNLEDQLKSGKLSQEEATKVQEEFNAVAGELEETIPGITDHLYDETGAINIQREKVDELAESYYNLAIAKAKATAYEEMLKEVYKGQEQTRQEIAKIDEQIETGNLKDFGIISEESLLRVVKEEFQNELAEYDAEEERIMELFKDASAEVRKLSGDTVEDVVDDIDYFDEYATKTDKKVKEAWEQEYDDLKYLRDMEKITEEEYYKELARIRDTYFTETDEEYREFNTEIHNGLKELNEKKQKENEKAFNEYIKLLDKEKDAAIKSMEAIENQREKLASRFKDELVLYTEFTVPNINGEGTVSGIKFADLKKQSEDLKAYASNLNALKGKADIPQEFFAQLRDMDTAEGKKVTDALLAMSDDDFKAYLGSWQKYQDTAEDVSNSLLSDEFENLANEIAQKFGKVPEEFFDIGVDSAEQYGEGFMQQLGTELQSIRQKIASEWNSMSSGFVISVAGGGGGTTINNNTNVTVNSNGNGSETAQTRAWSDAMIVTQLKNG